jgi:hypothetical protein
MKIEDAMGQLANLDTIYRIHVPDGIIIQEDFVSRRRVATRLVFYELRQEALRDAEK